MIELLYPGNIWLKYVAAFANAFELRQLGCLRFVFPSIISQRISNRKANSSLPDGMISPILLIGTSRKVVSAVLYAVPFSWNRLLDIFNYQSTAAHGDEQDIPIVAQ